MKVNGENDDEEDGHNGNGKPLRSPTDDESELGLAYADSEDDQQQQHVVHHTSPRRNPSGASSSSAYSRGGGGAGLDNAMEALLRSPGSSTADLDFDVPIVPPTPTLNNGFGIAGAGGSSPGLKPVKLPVRSHTSPSQRDSARVSPGVGGAAALNVGLNGARRGGTISGAIGGGHGHHGHGHGHGHGHDDDDATSVAESEVAAGKKASVSTGSSSSSSRKPRVRDCVRCGKRIEDGRWIRVESGKGVLCDRCWKNMYLPKVSSRRLFYVKTHLACGFLFPAFAFAPSFLVAAWLRRSPWRLGSLAARLSLTSFRSFSLFLRLRPSSETEILTDQNLNPSLTSPHPILLVPALQPAHRKTSRVLLRRAAQRQIPPGLLQLPHVPETVPGPVVLRARGEAVLRLSLS